MIASADSPFSTDDPFSLIFSAVRHQDVYVPRDRKSLIEFDDEGPKDERGMIIQELWDTEKKYVQDLEIMVNVRNYS